MKSTSSRRCNLLLSLAITLLALMLTHTPTSVVVGFSVNTMTIHGSNSRMIRTFRSMNTVVVLKDTKREEDTVVTSSSTGADEATKISLEEKMKNWEASDEEIKAATLGGVVPERADGFDVGLYIAFPFMVIGCLLFLAFPLLVGNIDVSSVGPPPTS